MLKISGKFVSRTRSTLLKQLENSTTDFLVFKFTHKISESRFQRKVTANRSCWNSNFSPSLDSR